MWTIQHCLCMFYACRARMSSNAALWAFVARFILMNFEFKEETRNEVEAACIWSCIVDINWVCFRLKRFQNVIDRASLETPKKLHSSDETGTPNSPMEPWFRSWTTSANWSEPNPVRTIWFTSVGRGDSAPEGSEGKETRHRKYVEWKTNHWFDSNRFVYFSLILPFSLQPFLFLLFLTWWKK